MWLREWKLVLRTHATRILMPVLLAGIWLSHWLMPESALAVDITSGSVAGLAGIGSAVTGDADSMEWNPAALGERKYAFQFIVTPISARLASDDWSIEHIIGLFNDWYTPEERAQLIAELDGNDLKASVSLSGGAHLALGGNGIGASVRGYAQSSISADTVTLLLHDAEVGKEYHLAGTEGESLVLGDVRIASAYSDPWLARVLHITGFHMGGTLRYLHGLQYSWADVDGDVVQVVKEGDTYKTVGDGKIHTWKSESGWGMATDLGLLVRFTPSIAVDVSMTDLGLTLWDDVAESVLEYQVDPATGVGAFKQVSSSSVELRPFRALPTKLRAGLSISEKNGFLWSLRYARQMVGKQAGEDEWVLSMQLNRWEVLPLRLAAKYDTQADKLQFAFGLGLHLGPLVMDVGTPNLSGLLDRGKDASVSVSTGLRF